MLYVSECWTVKKQHIPKMGATDKNIKMDEWNTLRD